MVLIPDYFTYTGTAAVFFCINFFVELYFIVYQGCGEFQTSELFIQMTQKIEGLREKKQANQEGQEITGEDTRNILAEIVQEYKAKQKK